MIRDLSLRGELSDFRMDGIDRFLVGEGAGAATGELRLSHFSWLESRQLQLQTSCSYIKSK